MINETLKAFRIANEDISLKDLSKKLDISSAYLSELESGKKKPSISILKKLATFYNIPLSKLVEIDEYNDSLINDDLSFQKTLYKVLKYYTDKDDFKNNNLDNNKDGSFIKI